MITQIRPVARQQSVAELTEQMHQIRDDYVDGRYTATQALALIEQTIGQIIAVDYKEGLKFKLQSTQIFDMRPRDVEKSSHDDLAGLAALAYQRAQQNGSRFPGQVHISRRASSCHHKEGFLEYVARYSNEPALV